MIRIAGSCGTRSRAAATPARHDTERGYPTSSLFKIRSAVSKMGYLPVRRLAGATPIKINEYASVSPRGQSRRAENDDQGRPGHRGKPAKACRRSPMARVHRFCLCRDLGNLVLVAFGRLVSAQSAGCRRGQADRQSHARDEHGFRLRGTPAGSCQRRSDHATRGLVDAGGRRRRGIEQCRAARPDRYIGRAGWNQSDAPRPLAAGSSSCICASGGK